jgi:hypothetical protein
MKVKVDISRLDYWNFNKYAMLHIPKMKRSFLISIIGIPAFIIICAVSLKYLLSLSLPLIAIVIIAVIGGAIGDIAMIILMKSQVMRLPADKPGLLGEHIIEINASGVLEKTVVNEGLNTWKGVHRITQNESYIFVFIDDIAAHIIPKRAFASEQESNAFYSNAVALWHQNR